MPGRDLDRHDYRVLPEDRLPGLTDLAGARRVDPDVRGGFNFELARSCCTDVLNQARRYIVPAEVKSVVSDSKSCAELARGLARSRG